jgi:hypothetical protein
LQSIAERCNSIQIVCPRRSDMNRMIDDLKDQAERAERLARAGMDPLTVECLQVFAEECRNRIAALEREQCDEWAAVLPAA